MCFELYKSVYLSKLDDSISQLSILNVEMTMIYIYIWYGWIEDREMIALVTGIVLLRLIRKQSIYHLIILSSDSVLLCPVIAVITF